MLFHFPLQTLDSYCRKNRLRLGFEIHVIEHEFLKTYPLYDKKSNNPNKFTKTKNILFLTKTIDKIKNIC